MGGIKDKKRKRTNIQQNHINNNQEEYDLKKNFSKFNKYRTSEKYQTTSRDKRQIYSPPIDSIIPSDNMYDNTMTNQFGDSYFRLEEKITALSDKNDTAHDNLRKEFDGKIDKVRTELKGEIKDKKDNLKWKIGFVISVILAVIGYFVLPYQKSSKNEKEIIRINERIKESIKPSIDRNSYNIEKNAAEIKSNYEKIILLQNNESKRGSK